MHGVRSCHRPWNVLVTHTYLNKCLELLGGGVQFSVFFFFKKNKQKQWRCKLPVINSCIKYVVIPCTFNDRYNLIFLYFVLALYCCSTKNWRNWEINTATDRFVPFVICHLSQVTMTLSHLFCFPNLYFALLMHLTAVNPQYLNFIQQVIAIVLQFSVIHAVFSCSCYLRYHQDVARRQIR